jgi:hypothetical protein
MSGLGIANGVSAAGATEQLRNSRWGFNEKQVASWPIASIRELSSQISWRGESGLR